MRTKHAEREVMLGAPCARFRLGGMARYLPGHRPRDQVWFLATNSDCSASQCRRRGRTASVWRRDTSWLPAFPGRQVGQRPCAPSASNS